MTPQSFLNLEQGSDMGLSSVKTYMPWGAGIVPPSEAIRSIYIELTCRDNPRHLRVGVMRPDCALA
jgi:hypothetical protein